MKRIQQLIKDAKGELQPWEPFPESKLTLVAQQCGGSEVREIIELLDSFALELSQVPEWDGDTQDDIAAAQHLFATVLALVPPEFTPDIVAGLKSPHPHTRARVAYALEQRPSSEALSGLVEALQSEQVEWVLKRLSAAHAKVEQTRTRIA